MHENELMWPEFKTAVSDTPDPTNDGVEKREWVG